MTKDTILVALPASGLHVAIVVDGQPVILALGEYAASELTGPLAHLIRTVAGQLEIARAPGAPALPPTVSYEDIRRIFVADLTGPERTRASDQAQRIYRNLCKLTRLVRRYCTICQKEPGVCEHHRYGGLHMGQAWYENNTSDWVFDVATLARVTERVLPDYGIHPGSRRAVMQVVAFAREVRARTSHPS